MQTIYLPDYTIGVNAYQNISDICSTSGTKVVMIGGKTAFEKAKEEILNAVKNTKLQICDILWYGGEAALENVETLKQHETVQDADMIFAVGGGKALDTCKILSDQLNKDLYAFPTIASTCAAITSICAVYNLNGTFIKPYYIKKPATHTFINTKIIAEAPEIYLWAGIGDTLAKGYEPEFSSRGKNLNHINSLGITLSKMCYEPLVQYGIKAMNDCKANKTSNELEETILAIIITTGLVSNCVIFDYNTGAAHALCYGFTTIHDIHVNHLHGELVSYGVLVQLLIDDRLDEVKKLIPFYQSIQLPTKLKDIDANLSIIDGIIEFALLRDDIKVSCKPITFKTFKDAILALELL